MIKMRKASIQNPTVKSLMAWSFPKVPAGQSSANLRTDQFQPMKSSKRAFPLSLGPWTSLLPDTSLPVRKLFAKVAGVAAQCPKSSP